MARWVALLLLVVAPAPAQEPDAAEIRRLIAGLGSGDRGVRERSSKTLLRLGAVASSFAMEALGHQDPEVRRRARAIWRVPTWAWAPRWARYDPETRMPREVLDRRTCIRMVLVPAGEFRMADPRDPEGPQRVVTFRHPFYLGRSEVTRSEWERVMAPPGGPPVEGGSLPVTGVPVDDLERFLALAGMRLPADAEWAYAHRAGSPDKPPEEKRDSRLLIHPVACGEPNAFGLYDMAGNAKELCADQLEAMRRFGFGLGPWMGFRVARDPW